MEGDIDMGLLAICSALGGLIGFFIAERQLKDESKALRRVIGVIFGIIVGFALAFVVSLYLGQYCFTFENEESIRLSALPYAEGTYYIGPASDFIAGLGEDMPVYFAEKKLVLAGSPVAFDSFNIIEIEGAVPTLKKTTIAVEQNFCTAIIIMPSVCSVAYEAYVPPGTVKSHKKCGL